MKSYANVTFISSFTLDTRVTVVQLITFNILPVFAEILSCYSRMICQAFWKTYAVYPSNLGAFSSPIWHNAFLTFAIVCDEYNTTYYFKVTLGSNFTILISIIGSSICAVPTLLTRKFLIMSFIVA